MAAAAHSLEEQHCHLPNVKVDVMARLVRHVRTKVASDKAVPHAIVLRDGTTRQQDAAYYGRAALWLLSSMGGGSDPLPRRRRPVRGGPLACSRTFLTNALRTACATSFSVLKVVNACSASLRAAE